MNVHSRAGKKFQKVVKLSENAKRCSSPDRAARFVRRLPAHRDRLHPRFKLLLIRARYFEPTTGEFTSQDPLEYVDGMSLYRGYFVPGGVDPSGLLTYLSDDDEKIDEMKFDVFCRLNYLAPINNFEAFLEFVFGVKHPSLGTIANGCMGIVQYFCGYSATSSELGRVCFYSGWDSTKAYQDAEKLKQKWEAAGKCENGVAMFALAVYRGTRAFPQTCPKCTWVGGGLVPSESGIKGGHRMDYAYRCPVNDVWVGADHVHKPNEPKLGPMTVKIYPTLDVFYAQSQGFADFDTVQVCVMCRDKEACADGVILGLDDK